MRTDYVASWWPEADRLLEHCLHDVEWHREYLHIAGRQIEVPRRVAWCGDPGCAYRYSGRDHVAQGWPTWLVKLREQLEREGWIASNFVLLNLYRDGRDHMGWHTDDERGMSARVCALSLGATRRLRLRPGTDGRSAALDLEHGSLVRFDAALAHRLTPTRKPVEPRVSLTFRAID